MKEKVEALGSMWTREMLEELIKLRKTAIQFKSETFTFQDQEVDVSFAKYLIEYLENEFGVDNKPGYDWDIDKIKNR